ncbi:zonular occludens toxin [Lysobacteraceae bacterium NML07-0707]|nr:zonular occludens toxin [Xanthomonadaceae bacterium NML07-0707]
MILLLTGKPGSGKTAYGLTRARELLKKGREVYARGVKDLDYDKIGFKHIPKGEEWESYPDGSVFVFDEAYDVFPSAAPGSRVPPHIEAVARHRHRGFDFILICQQPLQLHWFLRGLIEEHVHVEKAFNSRVTNLKSWNEYQSNTKAESSNTKRWVRDKEIFEFYTSTVMDTSGGVKIPQWLKYIGILLLLVGGLVWYVKNSFESKGKPEQAEAGQGASTSLRATAAGVAAARLTAAEYAERAMPRLAAAPWSAPLYDERQPVAEPELICMSSSAGIRGDGKYREASCTCMTEQGTKYGIPYDVCVSLSIDGGAYNPYKRPSLPPVQPVPAMAQQQPVQEPADLSLPGTVIAAGGGVGGNPLR